MFYQNDRYRCGVYSLVNSLVALNGSKNAQELLSTFDLDKAYGNGRKSSLRSVLKEIGDLAGTTSKYGTSMAGVKRAIKALGYVSHPYYTRNPENAWRYIMRWCTTNPMILTVDHDEHYVTCTGYIDSKALIVDSDPSLHHGENGVYALVKSDLLDRWAHRGLYRAIRISRA